MPCHVWTGKPAVVPRLHQDVKQRIVRHALTKRMIYAVMPYLVTEFTVLDSVCRAGRYAMQRLISAWQTCIPIKGVFRAVKRDSSQI